MSQKTVVLCDRCGREIPGYLDIKNVSAKIQLWGVGEHRSRCGQRIDLCEDCYCDFVSFLDGKGEGG